jgi:hypothetical protein
MNTSAKGRRNENKTSGYLESLGYIVITTVRSSYRGSNDFFGLFDHIAVHKETGDTLYVQTTSNRNKPKAIVDAIKSFPAQNKQIIIWYDRIPKPKIIIL